MPREMTPAERRDHRAKLRAFTRDQGVCLVVPLLQEDEPPKPLLAGEVGRLGKQRAVLVKAAGIADARRTWKRWTLAQAYQGAELEEPYASHVRARVTAEGVTWEDLPLVDPGLFGTLAQAVRQVSIVPEGS